MLTFRTGNESQYVDDASYSRTCVMIGFTCSALQHVSKMDNDLHCPGHCSSKLTNSNLGASVSYFGILKEPS